MRGVFHFHGWTQEAQGGPRGQEGFMSIAWFNVTSYGLIDGNNNNNNNTNNSSCGSGSSGGGGVVSSSGGSGCVS